MTDRYDDCTGGAYPEYCDCRDCQDAEELAAEENGNDDE